MKLLALTSLLAALPNTGTAAGAPSIAPTVEIAPGVFLPMVSDGYDYGKQTNQTTNYTAWLQLGGRGIDTAWSYFNQVAVGDSLRGQKVVPRKEIFLTTKIECMGSMNSTIQAGILDLQQLGMDYIDLLLIHAPYKGFGEPYSNCSQGPAGRAARQATWKGMEALVRSGKVRAIGVSNFNASYLQDVLDVATIPPAVNQAAFCVGYSDNATIAFQKKHNITYQAYSPLGGSDWDPSAPSVVDLPQVQAVAQATNRTAAQVALRFILQRGSPLVTASMHPSYLAEDLDVFDWQLSEHDMAVLNSVRLPGPPP